MVPQATDPAGGSGMQPERSHGRTGGIDGRQVEAAVVVFGDRHRGRRIANRLAPLATVHQFDAGTVATGAADAHPPGDGIDDGILDTVTQLLADGAVAVVATDDDGRNLLVTQRLRTAFDAGRIYVVMNDPRNRVAFELPDVTALCLAELLADAVVTAEHGPQVVATDDD